MLNFSTIEQFDKIATPFYYYDMDLLRKTVDHVAELAERHDIKVHYAVKANVERRLLEYISSKGFGADCVSGNEVLHAHSCGFPADRIVYAGVGKTDKEIYDALTLGIEAFNCESLQEIYVINEMAHRYGIKANISVRINPDIDAHTHKYVTTGLYENKFGISQHEFEKLIEIIQKSEYIEFFGLHFHVGSQITRVQEVYALECKRVNEIVKYFERQGLTVKNINLGGGLGVDYNTKSIHKTVKIALAFHIRFGRNQISSPGLGFNTEHPDLDSVTAALFDRPFQFGDTLFTLGIDGEKVRYSHLFPDDRKPDTVDSF